MTSKRNNDEPGELYLGILFGIIAILILVITFQRGNFHFLFESTGTSESDIPNIFLVVLGLAALYYSIRKIIKANYKKNDT